MLTFLIDCVITLHYTFLGYLVVGGFIAWRWRRTIVTHVLTAIWGVLVITTHVPCPLTWAQIHLRHAAGLAPMGSSFIDIYVKGTLYPGSAETLTQVLVGLVVLASWIGFWRRPAHSRARAAHQWRNPAHRTTAGPPALASTRRG